MKRTLLALCICFALPGLAQVDWKISSTGILPEFLCYGMTARNNKVFAAGSKEVNRNADNPVRVPALFVSDDYGGNWQQVYLPVGVNQYGILGEICYTGKRLIGIFGKQYAVGPMRSDDGGKTWVPSHTGIDTSQVVVASIRCFNEKELVAAAIDKTTTSFFPVYYTSSDSGTTWQQVNAVTPPPYFTITLNMTDGKIFSACDKDYIYVSEDTCKNWQYYGNALPFISGDRLAPDLIVSNGPNMLVFGELYSSMNAFSSVDDGQTWQPADFNFIRGSYRKTIYDNGIYYAAVSRYENNTFGTNILVSRDVLAVKQAPQVKLSIYPNPAASLLHITGGSNRLINAEIYTLQGQLIHSVAPEQQHIDISGLAQGIYLLKAFDGSQYYTSRFIKQ